MKTPQPTHREVTETVERLTVLHDRMEAEGAHHRAATVQRAIDLIKRLAAKSDGHD